MAKHKFNQADWAAKKKAKEDLSKSAANINSVSELRERVLKIERVLGVKPSE